MIDSAPSEVGSQTRPYSATSAGMSLTAAAASTRDSDVG